MSDAMNVAIIGSHGRMGTALHACATAQGIGVTGAIDEGDDPTNAIHDADVVIDFSHHSATMEIARLCAHYGTPLVIGTTGHSEEERNSILSFTVEIPVVWSGNYSSGVNLLFYLTRQAAKTTGTEFHAEVIEMHHQYKVDAPSGTAEGLVKAIKEGRHTRDYKVTHGRSGIVGARTEDEIGVHSIRGGSIVGEHTVILVSENERIELTHKALDRSIFAEGAMKAAKWLRGKEPGLYEMLDVLGLNEG
jgi:4-hydroxy-tetrahydrodipicolinate reductase